MTLYVIALLAAHFFGDWILQSRDMAVRKSSDIQMLFKHCCIVSACLFFVAVPFIGFWKAGFCVLINFYFHALIDWHGWTIYKKKFVGLTLEEHFKNYWFYFTIAIDQFLHLAIIFLLFL